MRSEEEIKGFSEEEENKVARNDSEIHYNQGKRDAYFNCLQGDYKTYNPLTTGTYDLERERVVPKEDRVIVVCHNCNGEGKYEVENNGETYPAVCDECKGQGYYGERLGCFEPYNKNTHKLIPKEQVGVSLDDAPAWTTDGLVILKADDLFAIMEEKDKRHFEAWEMADKLLTQYYEAKCPKLVISTNQTALKEGEK